MIQRRQYQNAEKKIPEYFKIYKFLHKQTIFPIECGKLKVYEGTEFKIIYFHWIRLLN